MSEAGVSSPSAATSKPGQRLAWLDAAKGLGIILVVAGHTFNEPWIRSPIFLFHMPLFFLLSGYTMKAEPLGQGLMKRARSLLVPYASFFVLVTLVDVGLSQALGTPMSLNWRDPLGALGNAAYGGQMLRGSYAVFWFITCLLTAQLVFGWLLGRLPTITAWPWLTILALCVAGAYLAHLASPSPWNIAIAPAAMLSLYAGYAWRQFGDRLPIGLDIGVAIAAVALVFVSDPLDMKYAKFGTPALSLIAGLLLSYSFVRLSQVLAGVPGLGGALVWLGQASLTVMFLHMLVIFHFHAKWGEGLTFVAASILPLLIYPLLRAFGPTRVLLLGGR